MSILIIIPLLSMGFATQEITNVRRSRGFVHHGNQSSVILETDKFYFDLIQLMCKRFDVHHGNQRVIL